MDGAIQSHSVHQRNEREVDDFVSENSHWLSLSSSLAFLLKAQEKLLALALAFFKPSSLPYTTNGGVFLRPFISSLITAVGSLPLCAPWLHPDPHIALSVWLLCSFWLASSEETA
jgi:hypothetical protein